MTTYQANFIQKMRFFRKRAGITQSKLAEICNVSNGTIGNIESGITKPSFDLIIKIAEAVNVPPSKLFDTDLREFVTNDKLTPGQFEAVKDTVHSVFNNALSMALKDLEIKMEPEKR